MTPAVLRAFATALVKTAKDKAQEAIKGPVSRGLPGDLSGKPRTPRDYETMNKAKWIRTAKDLPAVIAATGVGYGAGKTTAEVVADKLYRKALTDKAVPAWVRHIPLAASVGSSVASYALGRSRTGLKQRREAASEAAEKK